VSSDTIWRPFGGRAPSAPRGWWRGPGIDRRHRPDGERDLGERGVRTRAAGYPGPVMADGCCGRGGCSGSGHDLRDGGQPAHRCEHPGRHAERDGTAILASDDIVSPLRQREVGHYPAAPTLRSRDRLVAQPEGNGRVELRAQRSPADDAPRSRRRAPHPSEDRLLAGRRQYEQLTAGTSERTGTTLGDEFGDAVQPDLPGDRRARTPMHADSAAVLVPALVLAAVVADVRTGSPIGREVVAILNRHMVVLDYVVVFHVVVGPRPPAPHGDCRLLNDDRWLVHRFASRDGRRDGAAAQVRDQDADEASPQQVSSHGPLRWGTAGVTDAARPIRGALWRSPPFLCRALVSAGNYQCALRQPPCHPRSRK